VTLPEASVTAAGPLATTCQAPLPRTFSSAGPAIQLALRGLDRGFRTVRGETAATDLQLQHLQRGPEVRQEQIVEDLRALTRRIVDEQPGVAAAAADRADPLKFGTRVSAIDDDRGPGACPSGWHGDWRGRNRRAQRDRHRHDGHDSRRAAPRHIAR
jgi:hypothetical protein